MKEVSRLYQALCHFKGAQGAIGDGKVDSLSKEFEDVAKAAFYTGYFLVNRGNEKYEYRIELTCLEFYYHEDAQDGIKDPRKLLKGKNTFYCEKGAVLPHNYGVDIIFDDDDEKFHASFLIRGFKSIEYGNKVFSNWDDNKKEWHPQYLWDYLFGGANMLRDGKFSIEWVDNGIEIDSKAMTLKTDKRVFSKKSPIAEDERLWMYFREID